MKFDATFFSTPTGQLTLVGLLAAVAIGAVAWQRAHRRPVLSPAVKAVMPVALPKVFTRDGSRVQPPPAPLPNSPLPAGSPRPVAATAPVAPPKPQPLPLALFAPASASEKPERLFAPFGRMIPCETVVALESNRLETPVVGLVTEDVWHAGRLIVPAGAEVHGRASTDRTRGRLAATGAWTLVWRTAGPDNGAQLRVEGIALDRDFDRTDGRWGEHDGTAGLRGTILRTDDLREIKLFAATFLATATAALQDTRSTAGLLGETTVPVATARNASLAGTNAILREYAQQIRDSIARDGFYLRVPAGKPFYLYITETLERSRAHRGAARTASHEN